MVSNGRLSSTDTKNGQTLSSKPTILMVIDMTFNTRYVVEFHSLEANFFRLFGLEMRQKYDFMCKAIVNALAIQVQSQCSGICQCDFHTLG